MAILVYGILRPGKQIRHINPNSLVCMTLDRLIKVLPQLHSNVPLMPS
jgi:hypothetical protein